MTLTKRVKLYRDGGNQTVTIPREFELPGEEAIIRKDGQSLIFEPATAKSLQALLKTLTRLDEDFPAIQDPAPEPVEI